MAIDPDDFVIVVIVRPKIGSKRQLVAKIIADVRDALTKELELD